MGGGSTCNTAIPVQWMERIWVQLSSREDVHVASWRPYRHYRCPRIQWHEEWHAQAASQSQSQSSAPADMSGDSDGDASRSPSLSGSTSLSARHASSKATRQKPKGFAGFQGFPKPKAKARGKVVAVPARAIPPAPAPPAPAIAPAPLRRTQSGRNAVPAGHYAAGNA